MSEAGPQGSYEVKSAPAGAGQRGRRDSHDWDEIVDFVRLLPGRRFCVHNVAHGNVRFLRQQYPDVKFRGFNRHVQIQSLKIDPHGRVLELSSQEVEDVYVTYEPGAHDNTSE